MVNRPAFQTLAGVLKEPLPAFFEGQHAKVPPASASPPSDEDVKCAELHFACYKLMVTFDDVLDHERFNANKDLVSKYVDELKGARAVHAAIRGLAGVEGPVGEIEQAMACAQSPFLSTLGGALDKLHKKVDEGQQQITDGFAAQMAQQAELGRKVDRLTEEVEKLLKMVGGG